MIYLNTWLSGTWQVQKIHADEFITALKKIKEVQVFTYPKDNDANLTGRSINRKHKIFCERKEIFKRFLQGLVNNNIKKLSENKKLLKIKREIDSINPDVILVRHNLYYFPIMEKLFLTDIPIVIEVNGLFRNNTKWIDLKNSEEIIEIERKIINHANALCCVSNNIGESIRLMGIDRKKIFIVPNGVDPLKFFPNRKSEKLCQKYDLVGKIVIGYVGGFEKNNPEGRDVIGMLEAFKIAKKITKIPIRLLMVGRMEKNFLRHKINELGINELVAFTGHIEHNKLPKIMNLIDIAVAPYFEKRLKDASPMKLFEYMAMEKPVIIPGVGQVSEIILNMESAVLVEAENISSLADALSLLIKNANLREKIGKNARRLIKKKYTWEHCAMHIAKACRFAMENRKLHQ